MSADAKPINVHILDKEYLVACPDNEREALLDAARHLDQAMRGVRDSGRVIGSERIAVITALNITHELLQNRREKDQLTRSVDDGVKRMIEKIELVMQDDNEAQKG